MTDDSLKPIDTIRLSPRDRQRLVEEIQRPSRSGISPKLERRRLRVEFFGRVVICLRNPDGGSVRYSVTPRNLSAHGLGFIHGQFVHTDRKCEVIIPTLTGEWLLSKARISRCKHLARLIHDVSLVFDEPIHLEDYVALNPQQALTQYQQLHPTDKSEHPSMDGQTTPLAGWVIIADDQATDRQLYTMWLGKLGLQPAQADSEQAIHDLLNKQKPVLLLIDLNLAGQSSLRIIQQLRQTGFDAPIIVSCDTESDQTQAEALAAGANAIITKPLDRASLHQIVEQLLLVSSEKAEPGQPRELRSQLRDDPDMQPLIHAFVAELKGLAGLIHEALGRNDQARLLQICTRIKCGSASYGFAPLTRMAKLTLGQIQREHGQADHEGSQAALNELTTLLKSVKAN